MKNTKIVYNQVNSLDAALHHDLANNKEKLYQSVQAANKTMGDDDVIEQDDFDF